MDISGSLYAKMNLKEQFIFNKKLIAFCTLYTKGLLVPSKSNATFVYVQDEYAEICKLNKCTVVLDYNSDKFYHNGQFMCDLADETDAAITVQHLRTLMARLHDSDDTIECVVCDGKGCELCDNKGSSVVSITYTHLDEERQ